MSSLATLPFPLAAACVCAVWSAAVAQAPPLDACGVLTREEITKLTTRDPGPPEPGSSSSGPVTTCYWQASPKGSVSLWSNIDPKEPRGLALKQLLDRGKTARAVPGLGDDAVFMENTGGAPGGTVFVRVGHWRAVIYREADTPQAKSESVLPTLTALAKMAVPKMRRAG
jgi:hypothetical protein